MGRTWVDFIWPLRYILVPIMAVFLVYLATWLFRAMGREIPWSAAGKVWLLLGAMTVGGLVGLAYGYMTYKPSWVKVIAPGNNQWTSWAMWEIPHEFLVSPEATPARLVIEPWGEEQELWLAEKVHVLRHDDNIVVTLEPSRLHDPLTWAIDREAIKRVSHEAERRLEEALDGYVMRRSGVRLEARRLLAKLLSLERQLEKEFRDTAKGKD